MDEQEPRSWIAWVSRPWVILLFALVLIGVALTFSFNRIMVSLLHAQPEVVVPKIEVRWPSGVVQTLTSVKVDQVSVKL